MRNGVYSSSATSLQLPGSVNAGSKKAYLYEYVCDCAHVGVVPRGAAATGNSTWRVSQPHRPAIHLSLTRRRLHESSPTNVRVGSMLGSERC